MTPSQADLRDETDTLRARLAEAEEMLRAIRHGEIDALVVEGAGGSQVYTLHSADEPYRHLVEEMQEGAVVLTPSRRHPVLQRPLRGAGRRAARVGARQPHRPVRGACPTGSEFEALLRAGSGRRRSRLVASDSGALEVSLSLTTTVSASGDRLNLIVTDLSELLAANSNRDRAEHDNRTKDEFLAMLAHELRTPLSAISAAVRVLELTNAGEQPGSRARDVIARQVGHVTHLINDLLDVERVVSGKIRLNRQPLDMAEAVRQAVATFTGDAQLDRRIDISTEPVWVDWDAERLEQVLTNIVTNAVKYTPPGGRDSRVTPRRRRRRRADRRGHRLRHLAEVVALHLRHVRAGRSDAGPRAGRSRDRPDARPPPRRAARGHDRGVERGRRAGKPFHGPAEADSCGERAPRCVSAAGTVVRHRDACS